MSRKKKKKIYIGYNKHIPENLKVVMIEKKVDNSDGFIQDSYVEKRWIIVDADTEEVFDDAQGYGYKTPQKAHIALKYKSRPKSEFVKDAYIKDCVQAFCQRHRRLIDLIGESMLDAAKCHEELSDDDVLNLIPLGIQQEMNFTVKQLLKYW